MTYEVEIRPKIKVEVNGRDNDEVIERATDLFCSVLPEIESKMRGEVDWPIDVEITAEW